MATTKMSVVRPTTGDTMLNHTLDQISELRLLGFKAALIEQMEQPGQYSELAFEERLSLLIDQEVQDRKNRKIIRLLRNAKLKYKSAYLTDIDYHSARGLKKSIITSLSQKQWIDSYQNLIITGPTGTGKTWLANALTNHFITSGYSALYLRIAQLINEVALVRAEGTYIKWLKKISRFQLLVLDDLGLSALTTQQAQELLEVVEERNGTGSIIVTSQLPVKEWYSYFKNPTLADAIMDRLIHNSYRINLKGESMRKTKNSVNHSYTSE